jgi:alkylation response protein AidB-like acyl-CoA dehydrogenase/electron transfer flavoprotein alpha subunit/flavin-dependent dehydrogenase/ferredoxin-like protein FixX
MALKLSVFARHCYTVLRPVYDPYWAELARSHGAMVLSETTVTSLIRRGERVVGVDTEHGPVYSEVVFIAEGDASHLIRRERLERVTSPRFMQGVKAVLKLPPAAIEERFRLSPGEGCAHEYLIRNGQSGGQTLHLNIAAFLYTNRDSLSFGYVVPLDNLKENYRGDHSRILEWLRGLPHFRTLLGGATLSACGTKLIRTGGMKEQPVLVEDGLAVGGAATGLGIDLPYPNFTGPASASGMIFGRAVRGLLKDGQSITADRLRQSYLEPLHSSVYGKNAAFLSNWPDYLDTTRVLFGRSTDLACGFSHFLAQPRAPLRQASLFLRGYVNLKSLRELTRDGADFLRASGLRGALLRNLTPVMLLRWIVNIFKPSPKSDPGFVFSIESTGNQEIGFRSFPWPIRTFINRLVPGLAEGMRIVYANDGNPLSEKFNKAVRAVLERLSCVDFVMLPVLGLAIGILATASLLKDLIRYYVLRHPVDRILDGPVSEYQRAQQAARDLDRAKIIDPFEVKLASNSYRVGKESHIRVFWPDELGRHGDLAQSPLWSVCPARVYQYDPPLLGRGRVTINYENCIKCESCWHADDDQARWGRHTDHRLIYRPESDAYLTLLSNGKSDSSPHPPREWPEADFPTLSTGMMEHSQRENARSLFDAVGAALRGLVALDTAIRNLPASPDATRREWPRKIGMMALDRLTHLQTLLTSEASLQRTKAIGIPAELLSGYASALIGDRKDFEDQLSSDQVFHLVSASRRIREGMLEDLSNLLRQALGDDSIQEYGIESEGWGSSFDFPAEAELQNQISSIFPDRMVKEWEYNPVPQAAQDQLHSLISKASDAAPTLIYNLSVVSPALGLLSARHSEALRILKKAQKPQRSDLCAVESTGLAIRNHGNGIILKGSLELVPLTLAKGLLVLHQDQAWEVDLDQAGIRSIPTPGIGFRAAGLHRVEFNDVIAPGPFLERFDDGGFGTGYTLIALGAADYLARRTEEHAEGRIQFDQQMRDTEGRNGIAKLGAVKAMIARIEAWRLALNVILKERSDRTRWEEPAEWEDFCSVLSAMAFGPGVGQIGYDAGQVFGGFAYSEDDLLSRAYRDSAMFRFLQPARAAGARFMTRLQQRNLQLDALDRRQRPVWEDLQRGPVADLTDQWADCAARWRTLCSGSDTGQAGEAGAILMATRRVLFQIHEQLEAGHPVEGEASAASVLMGLAERAVDTMEAWRSNTPLLPVVVFPERPVGKTVPLPSTYEEICDPRTNDSSVPYRSGQFLLAAFDPSPRFVPEIQLHDPSLRGRWEECTGWFLENIWTKQYDGLHIERYVEKIHGIPHGVLDGFKSNGYFATIIPSELDGGGWWKSEYYILTTAAGRFGDAGLLLVIMASTSIGTTPMLLGLEKELPLAVQELEPLSRDSHRLGAIGQRLDQLISSLKRPDPSRLKKSFSELMALVDSRIRHTRVVKYLSANFLKAFYAAGVAGQRRDLAGFHRGLIEAKELFDQLPMTIREAVDELPRRERAHQFFLRKLSHGGISAFALTEPTAGSDTGGVKTTARPMSLPLTPLEDGRFQFELTGSASGTPQTRRYLIDADRIQFDSRRSSSGMLYEPLEGESVPIECDEYDYDTDEGLRYYVWRNEKRHFHDIGQIRFRNGNPHYEFYELTGAKMWITNGRVATQFCLYAQSPEGVTGFMVDRHSEGMKVGADERKMGQRGSPTNEIAIDQIRVPKECIIGYEGHGQVNALETLNVGRCGLAVASITLMRKLLLEAQEQLPASYHRDRLLGEAAAILFGADSVAFYLVGLFDRPSTESVRMESAVAKYLCSEDLHDLIFLIEEAYGPSGATEHFRVEKIRRDSRILNIYEGTNEVQRFLILKDLIGMAKDWSPIPKPGNSGPEARLALWKETLRVHVKAAADLLGDTVWMDAGLQPTHFPLADLAGEIFRLDCLAYRVRWLEDNRVRLGSEYTDPLLKLATRSMERCERRLAVLDREYRRCSERSAKGLYAPETAAADTALDRRAQKGVVDPFPTGRWTRPFRILCLLRPIADTASIPRLKEGQLREIVWRINPADESAARMAVRFKEANPSLVTVHLAMPGGADADLLLRRALGFGADSAFRIEASPSAGASAFADAVTRLEMSARYDLIVSGASSNDGEGPLGPTVAGHLARPYRRAVGLVIHGGGEDLGARTRPDQSQYEILPRQPVVLGWEPVDFPPYHEINGLIRGQLTAIDLLPTREEGSSGQLLPARVTIPQHRAIHNLSGVADFVKSFLTEGRIVDAQPYRSKITESAFPTGPAVWTLLESRKPKLIPALADAAQFLGRSMEMDSLAIILGNEETWPGLAGLAQSRGMSGAVCIPVPEGPWVDSGRVRFLEKLTSNASEVRLVADPQWADALAYLSGGKNGQKMILFTDVAEIDRREGLSLFKVVYEGKLRRSITLGDSRTPIANITISPTAEFPSGAPSSRFSALAINPKMMSMDSNWFGSPVAESPDDLSSAELIVDVGYGVRNQDGFRLVLHLKEVLEGLGAKVHIGATRKVTQDLKLLPLTHQIGQTGVRVNPKVILAVGVSGAPQHMDYIGDRAVIFAFNKDPQAPLMKLNETRPAPLVHPIEGDLFETIPRLIEILSQW